MIVPINLGKLSATCCSYRALNLKEPGVSYALEVLLEEGYSIIEFEAQYVQQAVCT